MALYVINKELKIIYGRVRLFYDYQSSINLSKILRSFNVLSSNNMPKAYLMQSFRFGWIAGKLGEVNVFDRKRFIFRYTISYKPAFLNDITFFAQYYYGQDYYNIYFTRTLKVLRFGIAAKTSIFN